MSNEENYMMGKKNVIQKNDNLSTHFLSKIYLLIAGLIPRDQEVNMKSGESLVVKKRLIFSEFITSYHLNLKCFDGKVRNPLPAD